MRFAKPLAAAEAPALPFHPPACGLPARFFSGKVTPSGLPESLVTMETTRDALASLKTLCANAT